MTREYMPVSLRVSHLSDPDLLMPWALIAPHEEQAQRNHYQSLDRLASRGGLCPSEAYAIMRDERWRSRDEDACLAALRRMVTP